MHRSTLLVFLLAALPAQAQDAQREFDLLKDESTRNETVERLARDGAEHVIPLLVAEMAEASYFPEVGGHYLGIHGRYGYMPWAVFDCGHTREWKRNWAARALARIGRGKHGKPVIAAMIELLMGDRRLVGYAAQEVLVEIGETSIAPLVELLGREFEDRAAGEARIERTGGVRANGTRHYSPYGLLFVEGDGRPKGCNRRYFFYPSLPSLTLGRIGKKAVPYLVPLLRNEERTIRVGAAVALATIGKGAADAAPELIARTRRDSYWLARHTAAAALGRADREKSQSVPALILRLNDPVCNVRAMAVNALGNLRGSPDTVVSALRSMLRKTDEIQLLVEIAKSLEKYGAAAIEAAPDLLKDVRGLAWWRGEIRKEYAEALASMGRDVVPRLADALSNDDPATRVLAARALEMMGRDARRAIPQLTEALGDPGFNGPLQLEFELRRLPQDPRCHLAAALGNQGRAARKALPTLENLAANAGTSALPGLHRAIDEAIAKIRTQWADPDLVRSPLAKESHDPLAPKPGNIGECEVAVKIVRSDGSEQLPVRSKGHRTVYAQLYGRGIPDGATKIAWLQFGSYRDERALRGPPKTTTRGAYSRSIYEAVDPKTLGGERDKDVLVLKGDTLFLEISDAGRGNIHIEFGLFRAKTSGNGDRTGSKVRHGRICASKKTHRFLIDEGGDRKAWIDVTVTPKE